LIPPLTPAAGWRAPQGGARLCGGQDPSDVLVVVERSSVKLWILSEIQTRRDESPEPALHCAKSWSCACSPSCTVVLCRNRGKRRRSAPLLPEWIACPSHLALQVSGETSFCDAYNRREPEAL